MKRIPSAAQRAAEYLDETVLDITDLCLRDALLREDRERRQMERAIVAWWDSQPYWAFGLGKIARRLAARAKGKGG
jgi:hypothetical protein